jgi:uncharacterized iron-regulated membrane protein
MIENVMNKMGGVGVFGLISICLFFVFFIGMLVWTFCLKKPYLKSMRELPLDGEPAPKPVAKPTPNPERRRIAGLDPSDRVSRQDAGAPAPQVSGNPTNPEDRHDRV